MTNKNDNKISTSKYKVILYKFAFDDFDVFDKYGFPQKSGEDYVIPQMLDSSLKNDPVTVSDEELDIFIEKMNASRKDVGKKGNFSILPTAPAELDKNLPMVREYFRQYIYDKKAYELVHPNAGTDSDNPDAAGSSSLNWKTQPATGDLTALNQAHNAYISEKIDRFNTAKVNDKAFNDATLYDFIKYPVIPKEGASFRGIIEGDVTQAVMSIGAHDTDTESMKNSISFDFNLAEMPVDFRYLQENYIVDFYANIEDELDEGVAYGNYVGPTTADALDQMQSSFMDINSELRSANTQKRTAQISATVQKSKSLLYKRRFIGFITGISYSIVPGELVRCHIECNGLMHVLERYNLVKDRSIYTGFEKNQADIHQPGKVVFADNLNNKSVSEIFQYVIENILALQKTNVEDLSSEIKEGIMNDARLKEVYGLTFIADGKGLSIYKRIAGAVKDMTSWALLTTLYFKVKAKYSPELETNKSNIQQLFNLSPERYMLSDIIALEEGNEFIIRAYNIQIKKGHAEFYNQFSSGSATFKDIRDYAYYETFEDRTGTLICRPDRVNHSFVGDYSGHDYSDYFKIRRDDVLKIDYNRNDGELTSRVDYSPLAPLKGQITQFGLNYTDSQLVYKYGHNIREGKPATNPNALFWSFMPFFGAIALMYRNSPSRTMTVDVKGNRDYCLGRVYFVDDFMLPATIKDTVNSLEVSRARLTGASVAPIYADRENPTRSGWVGRLISMSTNYTIGSVITHTLHFTFVRRAQLIPDTSFKEESN